MQQNDDTIVLLTTAPNASSAKSIAKELLTRRLVACVNIIDNITSLYVWEDNIESEPEAQLIIKTIRANYQEIELLMETLHPYDVPELIVLSVEATGTSYRNWLLDNINSSVDRPND